MIYWVPPGPTQDMELMGRGGEGPSRSTPVSPAMVNGRSPCGIGPYATDRANTDWTLDTEGKQTNMYIPGG